jgi:hypothetical protein
MTSLIVCLGSGKGTWQYIARLIDTANWERVFLVTTDFGVRTFAPRKNTQFVVIDPEKKLEAMIEDIQKQLEGRIADFEVAVNLISGTGKEHMAIMAAALKLGLGIRMVALTEEGSLIEL